MKSWVNSFYDENFILDFLKYNQDYDETVNKLIEFSGIKSGVFYDQCCGSGYLSESFNKQGFSTIGVDISIKSIERANKNFPELSFIEQDVLNYSTTQKFDFIANWYTSFGSFPLREDHNFLICKNYGMLNAGGCFALDYLNLSYVLKNFKDSIEYDFKGSKITRTSIVKDKKMFQTWSCNGKSVNSEMHLFYKEEILEMLKKSGFSNISLFGRYFSTDIDNSDRLIILAKK